MILLGILVFVQIVCTGLYVGITAYHHHPYDFGLSAALILLAIRSIMLEAIALLKLGDK